MAELPFDIVGSVPEERQRDLGAFADELKSHPWGAAALQRLVVGDLDSSLRAWMQPAAYDEWAAGHRGQRVAPTGAKSFIAHDGLRTAVVPPEKRWDFLALACHEMVEACMDERHAAEGHSVPEGYGTHTDLSHVLWTEYVVERTRRGIATGLGWGDSPLVEGRSMVAVIQHLERSLPGLNAWAVRHDQPPADIYQLWFELARLYAMARGRADAGCTPDITQLQRFEGEAYVTNASDAWAAFSVALASAYAQPTASARLLDEGVERDGWGPLFEAFAEDWNARYEAELEHAG